MRKSGSKLTDLAMSAIFIAVAATFLALFAASNDTWIRYVALAVSVLLSAAAGSLIWPSIAKAARKNKIDSE